MGTLKLNSIVLIIILLISSCADPEIIRYDYVHNRLAIENWDIKKDTITNAELYCYEKNNNFDKLMFISYLDTIFDRYDSHKWTYLTFHSFPDIKTDKDYKLVINDTIEYKISNIETSYIIKYHMPVSVDSVYNMIKSMNINGREYIFETPRIFIIPNDVR